jgi:hypothetical protein
VPAWSLKTGTSFDRIRPVPGWPFALLVSLSAWEMSHFQINRPFWYRKCSARSGRVVEKPKLYGPAFRVLPYGSLVPVRQGDHEGLLVQVLYSATPSLCVDCVPALAVP